MAEATGQQVVPFEVVVHVDERTSPANPKTTCLSLALVPGQPGFTTALEAALIAQFGLPEWRSLVRWAVVKNLSYNVWMVEGAILVGK